MITIPVRVIPRASRSAIAGMRGNALLVRLAAPPVEGAANEALVAYLARVFGCPRRSVSIVSGHKARDKRIAVAGLSAEQLQARLSDILKPDPE